MSGPVYDDPISAYRRPTTPTCPWCNGPMFYDGKTGAWECPNGCHDVTPRAPEPVCAKCGSHINLDYGKGPVCGACLEEEAVMSPPHYTAGGIETIDYLRAKLTPDEFRGFCKGSVIKYLSRANLNGNEEQDYAKAAFYSRMLAGEDPRGEAE
jgi:hypothetical protein